MVFGLDNKFFLGFCIVLVGIFVVVIYTSLGGEKVIESTLHRPQAINQFAGMDVGASLNRSYNTTTHTFTVKDPLGNVLMEGTRTTPDPNPVIRSKSPAREDWRAIACYQLKKIDTKYDPTDVFTATNFYDTSRTPELTNKVEKEYEWRYKNIIEYKNVTLYGDYNCTMERDKNGTDIEKCHKDPIGFGQEPVYDYRPIRDIRDIKIEGEFCLFTFVSPWEVGEYVPSFFGEEFVEDASWSEVLEVQLDGYWDFDYPNGTTTLIDVHNNTYNGTVEGMTNSWVTGKLGNATSFEGSDDRVWFGDVLDKTTAAMSMNLWIKRDAAGGWNEMINKGSASPYGYLSKVRGDGTDHVTWGDGAGEQSSSISIVDEVWTMVTFVYDGGSGADKYHIYINGTLDPSPTTSGTMNGFSNTVFNLTFGTTEALGNDFIGLMDEIGIWNKALNSSNINQLYNSGIGLTYGVPPPCVFNGSVKDGSGFNVSGADIVIVNQLTNVKAGNTTSDANGLWTKNITESGNFTVYAYERTNVTKGGDIFTYVECVL